jgi:hypothetical protein
MHARVQRDCQGVWPARYLIDVFDPNDELPECIVTVVFVGGLFFLLVIDFVRVRRLHWMCSQRYGSDFQEGRA